MHGLMSPLKNIFTFKVFKNVFSKHFECTGQAEKNSTIIVTPCHSLLWTVFSDLKNKTSFFAISQLPAGCEVQLFPVQQLLRGPRAAAALAGIHAGAW